MGLLVGGFQNVRLLTGVSHRRSVGHRKIGVLVIIYGVSHRQMRKCIVFIPDTISDAELAIQLLARRHATEYFVYSKDKYWRGEDMVDHTVKVAVPIFNAAFPGCQAVFPPDNASNHSS